jgi:hypothetical protein
MDSNNIYDRVAAKLAPRLPSLTENEVLTLSFCYVIAYNGTDDAYCVMRCAAMFALIFDHDFSDLDGVVGDVEMDNGVQNEHLSAWQQFAAEVNVRYLAIATCFWNTATFVAHDVEKDGAHTEGDITITCNDDPIEYEPRALLLMLLAYWTDGRPVEPNTKNPLEKLTLHVYGDCYVEDDFRLPVV